LRPPEHGQKLLANAQSEWLAEEGAARGWVRLADADQAQAAANRGLLVVASYHNHHDDRPHRHRAPGQQDRGTNGRRRARCDPGRLGQQNVDQQTALPVIPPHGATTRSCTMLTK
jgi:hypothetical protein